MNSIVKLTEGSSLNSNYSKILSQNYELSSERTDFSLKDNILTIDNTLAESVIIYYLEAVTGNYGNEKLLVNKQMIKTGIEDIPNLYGLKKAINKKQSETEFLTELKKLREAYAQSVYQNHSNYILYTFNKNVNKTSHA